MGGDRRRARCRGRSRRGDAGTLRRPPRHLRRRPGRTRVGPARASADPSPARGQGLPATALALGDASCDVVAVVFTAHEVQTAADRDRFFREIARTLRPGGRVLLVEHHRDLPNFLAFGPGFLHFLPRREWLRVAAAAGMAVRQSARVTPWVTALSLAKEA